MSNEPRYEMEDGKYAFYIDNERLFETEEVAILFDKGFSVLIKHGDPTYVNEHYESIFRCSRETMFDTIMNDLIVIQGKFDIEELNKVISISDYIGKFWANLKDTPITEVKAEPEVIKPRGMKF